MNCLGSLNPVTLRRAPICSRCENLRGSGNSIDGAAYKDPGGVYVCRNFSPWTVAHGDFGAAEPDRLTHGDSSHGASFFSGSTTPDESSATSLASSADTAAAAQA
jgi:hypothetical protein